MTIRKIWNRLQAPEGEVMGGGAAPAPAPSDAPAPSAAPAASGASDNGQGGEGNASPDAFDFGALADFASGKEAGESASEPSAPAPAAPAPSPAPAPAPAPAIPAPPPPPPPAATPEQGAQPPAPAPAPAPASSEAAPQQVDWEKHRAEFLPKLEKLYALTDQEVQDIQTNPGAALPKLAAQLHYNVNLALQSAIREYLPHVVHGQFEQNRLKTEYENQFYSQWPALKEAVGKDRKKVEATINESIAAIRATNPKVSIEETMQKAGLLACLSLGITPQQLQNLTGAPPPAPAPASSIPPGRPAGTGMQAHVAPRAAPGVQAEDDLYGSIYEHHMGGG